MKYTLQSQIAGFPGLGKSTGKLLIWGFAQTLTESDLAAIEKLTGSAARNRVLLAVKASEDLLQDWQGAPEPETSVEPERLYQLDQWFFMVAARGSPEFRKHLSEAWSVCCGANIQLASAEPFWLGYYLGYLLNASRRREIRRDRRHESFSMFETICHAQHDGDCLVMDLWRRDLPERHAEEIEALLRTIC